MSKESGIRMQESGIKNQDKLDKSKNLNNQCNLRLKKEETGIRRQESRFV